MPSKSSGNFPPAGWTIIVRDLPIDVGVVYHACKLNTGYEGPPRITYDEAFKDVLEGAYGYV